MLLAEEDVINHRDITTVVGQKTTTGWNVKVQGPNVSGSGSAATYNTAVDEAVTEYSKNYDKDFSERTKDWVVV